MYVHIPGAPGGVVRSIYFRRGCALLCAQKAAAPPTQQQQPSLDSFILTYVQHKVNRLHCRETEREIRGDSDLKGLTPPLLLLLSRTGFGFTFPYFPFFSLFFALYSLSLACLLARRCLLLCISRMLNLVTFNSLSLSLCCVSMVLHLCVLCVFWFINFFVKLWVEWFLRIYENV